MGQFKTYLDKFLDKQLIKTENQIRELKAIQSYSPSNAMVYVSNEVTLNSRYYENSYNRGYFCGAYLVFRNATPNRVVIPRLILTPSNEYVTLTTSSIAGSPDFPDDTILLVKTVYAPAAYSITLRVVCNDKGTLSVAQELTNGQEFYF